MKTFYTFLLFSALCGPACAADGSFSAGFGVNGRTLVDVSSGPSDDGLVLRLDADGRLLMGGTCGKSETLGGHTDVFPKFCATRLRRDGSYDTTFGPGGVGYLRFDRFEGTGQGWPHNSRLADLLRLADGRILLVGLPTDGTSAILAALKPDGSDLDPSIGGGSGNFTFKIGAGDTSAKKLLQQPDGKVLVVGSATGPNGNLDMAAQRFLADFSVDPSYGSAGYRTVAFDLGGPSGDNAEIAAAAALQPDGSLVLAGVATTSSGTVGQLALARLTPDGQIDTSFGPDHDGRVHLAIDAVTLANTVRVDRTGRIVYAGVTVTAAGAVRCVLNRLLSDGTQDTTFNATSGAGSGHALVFRIPVNGVDRDCALSDAIVQYDGSVLATGSVLRDAGGQTSFGTAVRLTADGAFDPSFGVAGKSVFTYAPPTGVSKVDNPTSIAIGNGGLMIGGASTDSAGTDTKFAVARLTLDGIFADAFDD